ncbi:MAG: cysteine hydrolase [Actinomycetia bacterium]|nr:cysteine hydrolase [Actinomycetes bacterium]
MTRAPTQSTHRPRTLRELAGLHSRPPAPGEATLVVIDAQRAYAVDGALPLAGIEKAIHQVARLLGHTRSIGGPIVHVSHVGPARSAFDPSDGGRFIPEAAPADGESVVTKLLPNAFAGTNLAEQLRAGPGQRLVLCGFMTHMCISTTARAALDLGFDATVIGDATATRALPATSDGGTVPAEVVHRAALAALADRFADVIGTDDLLAAGTTRR